MQTSFEIKKYTFEHSLHHITVDDIAKFIYDVIAGKVKQSLKTESVPKTNSSPIKKVVGSTFEQIVKDSTKDVLIAFTVASPDCTDC